MTIRGRLQLIVGLVGVVVVLLSALAIVAAKRTRSLALEPQRQLDAIRRAHTFCDTAGDVAKELIDVAASREDTEDLKAALARARVALADLVAGATDPESRELAGVVAASFRKIEDGVADMQVLVAAGALDEAASHAREIGEGLYEDALQAQLEDLEDHPSEIAAAIDTRASRQARWTVIATVILVATGAATVVAAVFIVLGIRRRVTGLSVAVGAFAVDRSARVADPGRDELGQLAMTFNAMANDLDQLIETRAQKEALAAELELAAKLQQSLVPRRPRVTGLEIAGAMSTAAEVGGDYYDVIPTPDGAWIGIGDVSGHGFNAGVIMLMAQAAIASAIRANPDARPSQILRIVNEVLHDNVRERLDRHEHMTLTLLRYHDDGRVELAGAHQEIIVRGADGVIRTIPTSGPWMAVVPDVDAEDGRIDLARGETMVLFTDGVTEARTAGETMFGIERLVDSVVEAPSPAAQVRDAVFAQLARAAPTLDDDATVLVIRRVTEEGKVFS